MKHKFSIAIALLTVAVSAHATIYQCGNSFQGTPCRGAIIRSGAPTTDNDQSGARYAQMQQQQTKARAQAPAKQLKEELHVIDRNAAKEGAKLGGGWNSGVPNMAAYAPLMGNATATQARHHSNVGQAIPIVGGNGGVVIGIGGGLATGPNGHIYSDGGSSSNPYTRN